MSDAAPPKYAARMSGLRPNRSESEPATIGPGHAEDDERGIHQRHGRRVEAQDDAQVERHEDVQHAQATAAAAERAACEHENEIAVVTDRAQR